VVGFVRRPGVLACLCSEIDTETGIVRCPVAKVSSFGTEALHVTGSFTIDSCPYEYVRKGEGGAR
jgi:hypothetical protein